MKKCLLLGGAGFIGKNVALKLKEQGYDLTIYDMKVVGNYSDEELNGIKYYERELFKDEELEEVIKNQDVVLHFVSSVGPENSMINPERCYYNDVAKTVEILEIMRKNDVKKMIFISSGGTVYGTSDCESCKEDMMLNPKNHYGITKATIEKILHMYNEIYGMNNVILRVANPYGVGQQSNKKIGAVTVFAEKILNDEEISIWGDGENIRDYIYIDDVVKIISRFVEQYVDASNDIFNVGTGVGTSLNELIKKLEIKLDKKANVKYETGRSIDAKRNVLNMDNTIATLGNIVDYSLDKGIDEYMRIMKGRA